LVTLAWVARSENVAQKLAGVATRLSIAVLLLVATLARVHLPILLWGFVSRHENYESLEEIIGSDTNRV
jgi:hypothetical protein